MQIRSGSGKHFGKNDNNCCCARDFCLFSDVVGCCVHTNYAPKTPACKHIHVNISLLLWANCQTVFLFEYNWLFSKAK